jgi:hypothetical protein
MPQTVGFRSIALLQPNQDAKEKMKNKPNHKWKSAPPAQRKPTSPLERVIAAPLMTLKDADPDLFFKTLGALKCELAVEFVKITDMEEALKVWLVDRAANKIPPLPPLNPLALYVACTEAIAEGDDQAFDQAAHPYLTDKKSRK